ncbi:hypothetical protein Taro_010259 [Colocasia esculenta]|uniref:Uncharacterized protein n=1 Tax=Colocasia esculenta TaxID=4460 RepID=A0A843U925_COLES|nr:hypothetical protein [Colocasia esculenta]
MIISCTNDLCVKFAGVYRFGHGSVDTPIDGVDTGSKSLKVFHEDKVKCVDTAPGIPRKTRDKSFLEEGKKSGKEASTSRGAEQRRQGKKKEKKRRSVLVLVELGSIVIQRFEYFVLYFGAPVLWVGAVVLWCLSHGAQGLVNLLNSQVVFEVGRCAYLLGFFELLNSKRLESSCSSLYCTCASGSSVNKAMVATWSDDESSDCNEESSTSDENEICFMDGSSEEQVDISFELFTIEDWQEAYGVYRFCHGSVDTPIDGVDTGSESLKVFHEDKVKCVDTAPGSVNTSPRFQKT